VTAKSLSNADEVTADLVCLPRIIALRPLSLDLLVLVGWLVVVVLTLPLELMVLMLRST
jgi:hypothetical protein